MNAHLPIPYELEPATPAETYDARARERIRLARVAAGVLAVLFIGGAVLVPIRGAVVAPAQISPDGKVKRITHPTGGTVSAIMVGDGDRVAKGQILLRLDTSVTALDADLSQRTLEQLIAQRARLEAEVENRAVNMPAELARRTDAAAREAMASELRRYQLGRAERSSLVAQLGQRRAQLGNQIDGYRAQIAALRQQQALIEPELAGLRTMKAKGYATIARVNEMERTAVQLSGSIGALEAQIAQSMAAIAETEQQRIQVGQTARAQAGAELAQVQAAINQQRIASASAGDRFDRSAIRAPNAGTVVKLAVTTIGEVVQPAQTIMELVPSDTGMVFEGAVAPTDIDRVHLGQPARVRLSAFNQATTPEVSGKVTYLAADPVRDEKTGARYYPVRVALDAPSARIGKRLGLVSGMPGELFIDTGERSMISYLTKPLRDQFARAFRD